MKRSMLVVAAVMGLVTMARAQEPAPAAATTPQAIQRRGWFGISLSCGDCFIQRGAGRVAYVQRPQIDWVESRSPAYDAGLRSGDTLVAVNGAAITTPEGFEQFANAVSGTSVRLTVRRAGQERDVNVTPIDSPSNAAAQTTAEFYNRFARVAATRGLQALRNAFRSPLGWLGMGLECEQCSVTGLRSRYSSITFRAAPAILTVDVDGPAHRAGLRRGDTLTTIDGIDLTTNEGGRAFAAVEPGQHVTLGVRRGGAERHVALIAVARPDATPEELAAYDEYKRARDSSDAYYRQTLTTSVAQAQAQLRLLEATLRDMDASRSSADSTRRQLQSIDSLMRVLRLLERRKYNMSGFDFAFAYPNVSVNVNPMPAMPPMAPMAPMGPTGIGVGVGGGVVAPLRYSGRLGTVNIEGRSYGPISTQELGDSVVVVNTGGAQIRIYTRPNR